MMKASYIISIFLAAAFLSASCTKEEPKPADSITLQSEAAITAGQSEASSTVMFKSSGDWTAEVDEASRNWCSLNKILGAPGDNVLMVKVKENDTTGPRTATVTITCGTASAVVTVNQEARNDKMKLEISHQEKDFSFLEFWGNGNWFGNIAWGDGSTEDFTGSPFHMYKTEGQNTTAVEVWGAGGFFISSIGSINSIVIGY